MDDIRLHLIRACETYEQALSDQNKALYNARRELKRLNKQVQGLMEQQGLTAPHHDYGARTPSIATPYAWMRVLGRIGQRATEARQ